MGALGDRSHNIFTNIFLVFSLGRVVLGLGLYQLKTRPSKEVGL